MKIKINNDTLPKDMLIRDYEAFVEKTPMTPAEQAEVCTGSRVGIPLAQIRGAGPVRWVGS